jgi:hypothetical protein
MKYTPEEIAELLKERPNQPHYIAALVRRAINAALVAEATREPATASEIVKAGGECAVVDNEYLLDFRDGWKAAERFHGIRGSKT